MNFMDENDEAFKFPLQLDNVIMPTDGDGPQSMFGNVFLEMVEDLRLAYQEGSRAKYEHCCTRSDILLEYVWEQFYIGHWKDVPLAWRKVYSQISCIKASSQYFLLKENFKEINFNEEQKNRIFKKQLKKILRSCDMGLLMGYSLPNSVLPQFASYIHNIYSTLFHVANFSSNINRENDVEHKQKKTKLIDNESIETVYCPSLEYFQTVIMKNGQPVLMKNCIDKWPALCERRWTVDYIRRKAGCRLVPIEIGSKYTDDSWSQKLMRIDEFIQQYILKDTEEKGYLAQYQLFDQIEDLRKDIIVPDYCSISSEDCDVNIDINAWFGPANTVSPLHRDEKENLFCQVFGQKYFKLIDPTYSDKLHIHSDHLLQTTSQIDVENVDLGRFPDFHRIPYKEVVVEAGDVLYIPPMYWHFVKSLSTSFSVTFWWENSPMK
ncbi:hypothetical protein HELRODRAFT_161296 [Helobdella robusta]|uniref:JmjC domain-containing protein n=1 Tax=Helobdella robusta TaxID=6412 RepID=T1ERB0_HELRO|nr:hypothetical protein HELRODRAFT_161296 [Helobdella robusta]ESO02069.1 hypothetical protein HELRODRAFT_161296 [Helobdella robusta]